MTASNFYNKKREKREVEKLRKDFFMLLMKGAGKDRISRILILMLFFFAMLLFLSACGNQQPKETAKPPDDSMVVYYPVNDYIRRQIQDVDSTPYFLYRLQIIGGRKDSAVVSRATFDAETKQFLLPELEDKPFRNNFTESVFDDQSTNSITLTYTPKSSSLVQNVSVLLNKENQSVKWIFINTLSTGGDSTVIQHIGWKGDQSCYLNAGITYKNKPEIQRQLSFVWNEKKAE